MCVRDREVMDSTTREDKLHAVCIPYPVQGHINAMLQFAKLLYSKSICITFVHTEHTYNQILASSGPSSLDGLPGFRFEAIPDGQSASEGHVNASNVVSTVEALRDNLSQPFRQLLKRLGESGEPKATCLISDTFLSFTNEIAAEIGIPNVSFCSLSACGFWGTFAFKELVERGIFPLKSEDDLKNGYLDTPIDWIRGMDNIRLRDLPRCFVRSTDPNDILFNSTKDEAQNSLKSTAIVIHTIEDLEGPVLDAMSATLPPIYVVGPLNLMSRQIPDESLQKIGASLWTDDSSCLEWLARRGPGSVLYVNFGSLVVITRQQLTEFAWGLANSGRDFLWVIRPDVVTGDSATIPEEFLFEVSDRGLLISWCHQEQVLRHKSIGGFLTHCGWNSTMESISLGVPMICWPYFAEQQTNCRYVCNEWGIGLEINNDVKKEEVEKLVKELFEGQKGAEMRRMASKWKESANQVAKVPDGKSFLNLERLIKDVIQPNK